MDVNDMIMISVDDHLVEAFLTASRVLVAVAARSPATKNAEITLPQHRTLVMLASRGPQRVADLVAGRAEWAGVPREPSLPEVR